MAGKHQDPKYADRIALAPYNFVPLPEKILTVPAPAAQDHYAGLNGYFDCLLETCSPLFVRGMLTLSQALEGKEAKDSPQPYSLDGGKTPALPGSTLRGLLRTLVEVAAYSRPGSIPTDRMVYRSVGDPTRHGVKYRNRIMTEHDKNVFTPKVQAGYMRARGGDWFIQPAQTINGTTFSRIPISKIPKDLKSWHGLKNARLLYIKPGPYDFQDVKEGFLRIRFSKVALASANPEPGLVAGVLATSGVMFSKKSEAVVFPPDERSKDWLEVTDEHLAVYREQLSEEQKNLLGEKGVLRDCQPVFYLVEDEKLTFFGHTMMMRLPYKQTPDQLVSKSWKDTKGLDLAQALFGCVEGDSALAGRVMVSDARCEPGQSNFFERTIMPKVLGTPKPTTFQHYLVQPTPDDKSQLVDYDDDTLPRGTKFYWHKGAARLDEVEEKNPKMIGKEKVHTRIQPVRSGVQFRFQVRFENLTLAELGALVWVLELGNDPKYRLKLGMGKPLGLGAVKLEPRLVLTDIRARYTHLFNKDGWDLGESGETEQTLQQAIEAFQTWVLADREINPEGKTALRDLPRLQALLKLLEWPGPRPDQTRYLEIEHPDPQAKRGKRNEYKDRPVLPGPNAVGARPAGDKAPVAKQPDAGGPARGPGKHYSAPPAPPRPERPAAKPAEPLPEVRDKVSDAAQSIFDRLKQRSEEQEEAERERRERRKKKKK